LLRHFSGAIALCCSNGLHLRPNREGNRIFHGASDNAAGTAGVLELARAFRSLSPRPKRTIVFLWPTAEEKGLLGSHYYVTHPLYPLASTVANINLD
jgi:Zn-dependent M28 family amino/carboxypeptidase